MNSDSWLLEVARCPACLAEFRLETHRAADKNVVAEALVCQGCGARYLIRDGMAFFGLNGQAAVLRQQEMDAEVQWNFSLHQFNDHYAYAQRSFRIAQDAIAQLKKRLDSGRVLDAGAGSGCHSWQLCRNGFEVLAAELTPELLATASGYFYDSRVHFQRFVADCTVLPLGESTFDAVFCKELAHHVERLKELFVEFHRVLKAGGFLVLAEPMQPRCPGAHSTPDAAKRVGLTHQDYNLDDYLTALRDAGFHVEALRHVREPINSKYPLLHQLDSVGTHLLALNSWHGLGCGKRLRARLLGGEVVLLAKRTESNASYPAHRLVKAVSADRLDNARNVIAEGEAQNVRFLPLLEKILAENMGA